MTPRQKVEIQLLEALSIYQHNRRLLDMDKQKVLDPALTNITEGAWKQLQEACKNVIETK